MQLKILEISKEQTEARNLTFECLWMRERLWHLRMQALEKSETELKENRQAKFNHVSKTLSSVVLSSYSSRIQIKPLYKKMNTATKYGDQLAQYEKLLMFSQNLNEFTAEIEHFEPNSLIAYIVMMLYHEKQQLMPENLLNLIVPEKFLKKLNESGPLLLNEKCLSSILVDAFELMYREW